MTDTITPDTITPDTITPDTITPDTITTNTITTNTITTNTTKPNTTKPNTTKPNTTKPNTTKPNTNAAQTGITLTPEQESVYDSIIKYLSTPSRHGEPFVLSGSAGCGKTTLITKLITNLKLSDKYFTEVDRIDLDTKERYTQTVFTVALLAPTGKAASVLNAKQNVTRARTVHSFLYGRALDVVDMLVEKIGKLQTEHSLAAMKVNADAPDPLRPLSLIESEIQALQKQLQDVTKSKQHLEFKRKSDEEITEETEIIIVDEASMLGEEEANNLRCGLPIIFIGDDKQLPPVKTKPGVNLRRPDARLTTIMRQKEGSGILDLAYRFAALPKTGTGKLPAASVCDQYNDVEILRSYDPTVFISKTVDDIGKLPQFICYKNVTRHHYNKLIREKYARPLLTAETKYPELPFGEQPPVYWPMVGEQLLIDQNMASYGLTKGDTITVAEINDEGFTGQYYRQVLSARVEDHIGREFWFYLQLNDCANTYNSPDWYDPNDWKNKRVFAHWMRPSEDKRPTVPVQFRYCITCHKSQGSEFDRVVLVAEKTDPAFLYTGATRAKKALSVMVNR